MGGRLPALSILFPLTVLIPAYQTYRYGQRL